jgi:mutator protein MutT
MVAGARVLAYPHDAPWIDVNDVGGIRAAEALVARHAERFELWHRAPDVQVVGCVLLRDDDVLLEYRPDDARCYAAQWDTPGGKIAPGETPAQAMARELSEELGVAPRDLRPATRFDDVDTTSRRVFRHHVFTAALDGAAAAREGQRLAWHPRGRVAELGRVGRPALRSLAALEPPTERSEVSR